MRMSQLIGERYRDKPSEAQMASHIFLLRGGYIRQVTSGIYTLLPPAKRIAAKIERVLREEMDAIGGQEVLFPVVLPGELWRESGRYASVGNELLRFTDRTDREMVLGMTHEEAAVHLARSDTNSYQQYPFMIYQIQTKFRDEPRARGGLVRVREFTMKDAYSFHTSQNDLESYYDIVFDAYERIYRRLGFEHVLSVKSDTGMMGGQVAHEFMYLSDSGEDSLVLCPACGYRSNMEVAEGTIPAREGKSRPEEMVHTPGVTDIASLAAYLQIEPADTVKAAVFYKERAKKPVIVFLRGDLEVNEAKLRKVVHAEVFPWDSDESDDDALSFGYIGIKNLPVDAEIYVDRSLRGGVGMVTGANKKDHHLVGLDMDTLGIEQFADLSKVREGDGCLHCGKPLHLQRGIEVGNIFQLGDKYAKSMGLTYADKDGEQKIPVMGCYGIGVGRLISCLVEEFHDEYGPIWPAAVAPWDIHIVVLAAGDEAIEQEGDALYQALSAHAEVLIDDRTFAAGVKFADADLLGVPIRVMISKRNLAKGVVEIASRDKRHRMEVPLQDAKETLLSLVKNGFPAIDAESTN